LLPALLLHGEPAVIGDSTLLRTIGSRFAAKTLIFVACRGFRNYPAAARLSAAELRFILSLRGDRLKGRDSMTWTTPTLVEICIGLEINGYLPAEF
jgi:coenzyme PQQ precursor peptide PqqA